jgi:hypothetical protein
VRKIALNNYKKRQKTRYNTIKKWYNL